VCGVGCVGVFALVLAIGCRRNPAQPSSFRLGEPFDVRIGMRADFDGEAFFMFDDVPSDSRCPVDVQCVQAGEAVVSLRFNARLGPQPPPGTLRITAVGRLIIDGVEVPVPWCEPDPGTVNCRLTTAESKSTAKAGVYTIRLVGLTPVPRAGMVIARSDYVGTFIVSR
jgi:hypothetical protein